MEADEKDYVRFVEAHDIRDLFVQWSVLHLFVVVSPRCQVVSRLIEYSLLSILVSSGLRECA